MKQFGAKYGSLHCQHMCVSTSVINATSRELIYGFFSIEAIYLLKEYPCHKNPGAKQKILRLACSFVRTAVQLRRLYSSQDNAQIPWHNV